MAATISNQVVTGVWSLGASAETVAPCNPTLDKQRSMDGGMSISLLALTHQKLGEVVSK